MPLRLAHPDDWAPIHVEDPACPPPSQGPGHSHRLWWLVWSAHHRQSCHGMGIPLLSAWLWVLVLGSAVAHADSCAYPGAAWIIPLLLLPVLLLTCGGTSWPLGGHGSWLWVLLLASLLALVGGMALLLPGGATECAHAHAHAHVPAPVAIAHPWAR